MQLFIYNIKKIIPGLFLVVLITFSALLISNFLYIGSILVSILLGFLVNNFFNIKEIFKQGIDFSEKHLLNIAIICMGVNFNNSIISKIDFQILFNVLLFVLVGFFITLLICKLFNVSTGLSYLLAFGNAICGSSAIIAASSIIKSKKQDVILSVSIINVIGSLAIIFLPPILYFFSANDFEQGQIIGGTIQAVGQVSAAGYIINDNVGQAAVLIKMSRILFLVPALIILSLINSLNRQSNFFQFPLFIIGFLIIFLMNYFNILPFYIIEYLKIVSKYFLLFSMTALGLKVSINSYFKSGVRVFFISMLAFLIQISIVIQIVT